MNYEKVVKNIRSELKIYIKDNNIKSLVLGISGGIDSALCAVLAKPVCNELGIKLIGRSLPTISNKSEENKRAEQIGKLFCTDFEEISIQSEFVALAYLVYENDDGHGHPHGDQRAIKNGNIKARIRMIYLYDIASRKKGMVLSTDNYTEYLLGFWTLHGDVGDYGMIQNLWKTEVYDMAWWFMENDDDMTVNQAESLLKCIEADATDGLGITNSDLDQIMPEWEGNSRDGYKEVDKILQKFIAPINHITDDIKDWDKLEKTPVIQRLLKTEFKRKNPYNIPRKILEI